MGSSPPEALDDNYRLATRDHSWLLRTVMLWPTVILLIVAARQLYLSHVGELSPWKGGGFGMFAAMDQPGMRFLHCRGTTAEGEAVVIIPGGATRNLIRRLSTFPDSEALRLLSVKLLQAEYIEAGSAGDAIQDEFLRLNPQLRGFYSARHPRPVVVLVPRYLHRPGHGDARVHRLVEVGVSVWRSRFLSSECLLRADLVFGQEHSGDAAIDTSGVSGSGI